MRIEGVVRFQDPPQELVRATVRVRLLDTTFADASAIELADETIRDAPVDGDVAFSFEAPELSPRRSYTVAAHVDLSGSGDIEVGDFITMEAVPIESGSSRARLEVPVRAVRS